MCCFVASFCQSWSALMPLVAPFPDEPSLDITPELLRQHCERIHNSLLPLGCQHAHLPTLCWCHAIRRRQAHDGAQRVVLQLNRPRKTASGSLLAAFSNLNLVISMFVFLQSFWDYSMITRPEGREVVCHASAWDLGRFEKTGLHCCTPPFVSYTLIWVRASQELLTSVSRCAPKVSSINNHQRDRELCSFFVPQ
jgi:hypothetical protein